MLNMRKTKGRIENTEWRGVGDEMVVERRLNVVVWRFRSMMISSFHLSPTANHKSGISVLSSDRSCASRVSRHLSLSPKDVPVATLNFYFAA